MIIRSISLSDAWEENVRCLYKQANDLALPKRKTLKKKEENLVLRQAADNGIKWETSIMRNTLRPRGGNHAPNL